MHGRLNQYVSSGIYGYQLKLSVYGLFVPRRVLERSDWSHWKHNRRRERKARQDDASGSIYLVDVARLWSRDADLHLFPAYCIVLHARP